MVQRAQWSIPFANDGGPLIVLPRELLGDWQGTLGESLDESFPFGPDDTRACEAPYPAGLLKVGTGFGLVIGAQDHIVTAHWLRLPEQQGCVLVCWSYADDGAPRKIYRQLQNHQLTWCQFRQKAQIASGNLVLFHAASPGNQIRELDPFREINEYAVIGDALPIRLEPGEYAMELVEVGGNLELDPMGCILCRWV